MVVQHNLTAINANRYFGINNNKLSKSLEKLSSGYAINRAGDNAAGLAVSEKMRSQIAGINQGVKNAQDGISMVQTYEGALTETDSILQRMKTLATQSANGTYQDDVDREAIQLEFNQLNDELDQIADTDFNGVVALNGGVMADGTKAVDGKFDYANAERDPKQLTSADVNLLDSQAFDNAGTVKNLHANDVWKEISDNAWDRANLTANQGPDSVDVTLKFNSKDGTWSVENASNGALKAKFDVEKTDNGGFKLKTAAGLDIANVVLDATSLKNGDTITLTLNNPEVGIAAPTNAGATQTDASNFTESSAADSTKAKDMDLGVSINNTNVTDAKMTEDFKKIFDAFDGAKLDVTYASKKALASANSKFELTLSDGTTISTDGGTNAAVTGTLKDGTSFAIKNNNGAIEIYSGDGTDATKLMMTLTPAAHTATNESEGKISYKLGIEFKNYDTSKLPTVEIKSPENAAVSKSNSNDAATAPLTYSDHVVLQVGARTKDSVDFTFKYSSNGLGDLKANLDCSSREGGLGTKSLSLLTQEDANKAIDKIDNAINKVSMVRGTFGAVQNRLEHKIDNLNTTSENLTSAESRIRDTNMAEEMMNFTKNQILSQASQSMLAQANQLPQGVLSLLQ